MQRRLLIIGLAVIGVIILLCLAVSFYIYQSVTDVRPRCELRGAEATYTPDNFQPGSYPPPEFSTEPYLMPVYETVSFPSRAANITISGFFMPAQGIQDPTTAPAVIIVHGLNDCKRRTFVLTAAGMLNKQGFNVLALDMRDHGDSTIEDGRHAGGTEEYLDVLGGFDWLMQEKRIPEQRIGLMGFSMGAATAMIAAGEEPRIAAVWEDSGYGDLDKVIQSELARNHVPGFLAPGAVLVGKIFSGDNLLAYPPLNEVAKLNGRPIFIVHGDQDTRVSVVHASEIAAVVNANGGLVTPWITDSKHIESIFFHTAEYERQLVEFFTESLP